MDILPTEAAHEEAFLIEVSTLARRFAGLLVKYDAAEDLAQDIVLEFLVILRSGKCGTNTTLLHGWIWRTVRRRTIDAQRTRRLRASRNAELTRELQEATHAWMAPDVAIEEDELVIFHARTLASLSYECRRAYVMVREEEASYRAVATQMGVSRAIVHNHVAAAHRRFRAELEQKGLATTLRTKRQVTRSDTPAVAGANL